MDTRFLYVKVVIFISLICIEAVSPAPFCLLGGKIVYYAAIIQRKQNSTNRTMDKICFLHLRYLLTSVMTTFPSLFNNRAFPVKYI